MRLHTIYAAITVMLLATLAPCWATAPVGGEAGSGWDPLWETLREMGVPEEAVEVAMDFAYLPFEEAREKYELLAFKLFHPNMTHEELLKKVAKYKDDRPLPPNARRGVSWSVAGERVGDMIRFWLVTRTEGCNLIHLSWLEFNATEIELERRDPRPSGKPIKGRSLITFIVDLELCEVRRHRWGSEMEEIIYASSP
ncbi:MAG: hypothetical protein AOA65_1320 [Candidatus Bathyarchaeota archaeon BA1]|nr:MAG: hypothetical protein AOA65_1320 [Candidatus Bathyarchaeota archaeon BA1]